MVKKYLFTKTVATQKEGITRGQKRGGSPMWELSTLAHDKRDHHSEAQGPTGGNTGRSWRKQWPLPRGQVWVALAAEPENTGALGVAFILCSALLFPLI